MFEIKVPDEEANIEELAGHNEPSFIAETSFVRAPLNSRVSSVNVVPTAKGKAKQHESLDRVPLEVQEALILEDLLYVLMVNSYYAFSTNLLVLTCT